MEQACDAMGLPDKEQVVSLVEKPDPSTCTIDPTEADDGLSVMNAVEVST